MVACAFDQMLWGTCCPVRWFKMIKISSHEMPEIAVADLGMETGHSGAVAEIIVHWALQEDC